MTKLALGREWPLLKRANVWKRVWYKKNRHLICFGPSGSGKGVSLEIPNLLRLGARRWWWPFRKRLSIVSIDPKGENACVTARWRKRVSKVVYLNPLNEQGLPSSGFNPLKALDRKSPHFFQHCSAIAEGLIRITGKDPFFDTSARNLVLALIMWEVALAETEGRDPLLKNVRGMLTGDLPAHAEAMFKSGDFVLASLAGQFREKNKTNDGIVASASTQTQWLLDQNMLDDLAKDGIDWASLKKEATTVYVILPAHALETFACWLRLVVACAFNALYRQGGKGGLRTLFLLSEFAQLGELSMIRAALGQGRGYNLQLFPVVQDINQLRAIYGKDAANTFLGMAGACFAFAANDPETAAWMSLRSGKAPKARASFSQSPQGGVTPNVGIEDAPLLEPDDMYDIPDFHGLVFFAGESKAKPVYAPPYWDARGNPDLIGRYDKNPFHPGSTGGPQYARRALRLAVRAACVALLMIGGAALLQASGQL
jgi:type IV secretion system protein VirD4